jgi:hypothetical protein
VVAEGIDALFEVSLKEFTAARNELAARLKKEGHAEDSARVKALRKPTVSAWAVNQLARHRPDDVKALLEAGDRLRAAQESVVSGAEPAELRDAVAARRELVARGVEAAAGFLEASGSPPQRERITNTLLAATTDERAAALVAKGRVSTDLDPTGTEWFTFAPLGDDGGDVSSGPSPDARREAEELGERALQAEERARELTQRAEAAQRMAEEVMMAASEGRRAARDERRRADEAVRNLGL